MAREEDKKWHTRVKWLKALADLANIGIVLHIIVILLPLLLHFVLPVALFIKCTYFINHFDTLAKIITAISDPFIYLCKGSNRMVRLHGRKHGVEFIEEKYGLHDNQDKADMISAILFGLAITAFILSHFFFPFLSSVAWVAGLVGTGINIYFDETYPAKKAAEKFKEDPKNETNEYYKEHYYESIFYALLLISLFVFLPCKALALSDCFPDFIEKTFKTIAAIGSGLVVLLNLIRASNILPCCSAYQKLPGLEQKFEAQATFTSFPTSSTRLMGSKLTRKDTLKPSPAPHDENQIVYRFPLNHLPSTTGLTDSDNHKNSLLPVSHCIIL